MQFIKGIFYKCFFLLGIVFFLMILLSFTTLPFWMYFNLGQTTSTYCSSPDYIVVLGGGGMPSESGLMRTYRASEISKKHPNAKVIIALPGDTSDEYSSVNLMRQELINRGVDSLKIMLENAGCNTRMQALNIFETIGSSSKVLIVTSPDHMYRATKAFKKAGMQYASGKPALEKAIESELFFNQDDLGGKNCLINVGYNTQIRYQFWNHFRYQILVYREYAAISYYKLKGWI
ncbi:MAG: YdcF family protein [Salinivirgaceae bacterium]|nr:YdcF family protein [Salinivirgaceae bacterium]